MVKLRLLVMGALSLLALVGHSEEMLRMPVVVTKAESAGAIFASPVMNRTEHADGHVTLDVTSLISSDGKFASGMYKSEPTRIEVAEGYGVDEFMYFLEGGVKLTSPDGTVQIVGPGDALAMPKEWKGVWETDGYTKFWVIYSADGEGLQ